MDTTSRNFRIISVFVYRYSILLYSCLGRGLAETEGCLGISSPSNHDRKIERPRWYLVRLSKYQADDSASHSRHVAQSELSYPDYDKAMTHDCTLPLQYLLPAIQSRPEAIKISEDDFAKLLQDVQVGRVRRILKP
jgi:hypothetical protein